MLDKLIDQLQRELNLEEISSEETHHYSIPIDDDIQVEVFQLDQNLLLKGVIGEFPKENGEAFLLQVMEANLFGRGTRGTAIGFNENGNMLTLSLLLDYNSTYKDFKEKLEDFVSVMDFWRKEALEHH